MVWQLQAAKQRFSELVRRAVDEGPQFVTKHGRETVVVLDVREYRKLKGVPMDFKEFLMTMPPIDDLEIERSKDVGRDVEL